MDRRRNPVQAARLAEVWRSPVEASVDPTSATVGESTLVQTILRIHGDTSTTQYEAASAEDVTCWLQIAILGSPGQTVGGGPLGSLRARSEVQLGMNPSGQPRAVSKYLADERTLAHI